jgi:hypothetical protein
VICEHITDTAKDQIAEQRVQDEDRMLGIIRDNPKASMADLAIRMGWKLHNGEPNKMKVSRCINGLKKAKLLRCFVWDV